MTEFLTAAFRRRTWAEAGYVLVSLPLSTVGFAVTVAGLCLGVTLLIVLIGFAVLAVVVAVGRVLGSTHRSLGCALLGIEVAEPPPLTGRFGVRRNLGDITGWRALLFFCIQFPVAMLDFLVVSVVWVGGFGAVTYWFWHRFLPPQPDDQGVLHRAVKLGPYYVLDTPARIATTAVLGVVLLVIAPWVVRLVLTMDRALIAVLLGPTAADARLAQLETTRSLAVDDAASALRRIERDLHDGAQARLVALAMTLGLAKEELEGDDPALAVARTRIRLEAAHLEAKGTINDLRDLAHGIHPPALDRGLDEALTTLCSRTVIPVQLHVSLPQRPSQAVETILYFSTAELLTNVTKHSGARHAWVTVQDEGKRLVLRVGDDGAGGAAPGRGGGSGLSGLTDRVATVDGTVHIDSPDDGPTTVTVEVPLPDTGPGGGDR